MKDRPKLAGDSHDRSPHAPTLRHAHAPALQGRPLRASQHQHIRGGIERGAYCRGLLRQIEALGNEIAELNAQIEELSKESRWARLLQTMPGVGPITAMAIEAFAPPIETFRRGRDFAAWLGLVPRQNSTGGKARLGKVSKAGQHDIRRLLIIGAMAAMVGACRRGIPEDTWLGKLMLRKPRILVAIALANKMARRIWAMLTKGESYRDPALAAA